MKFTCEDVEDWSLVDGILSFLRWTQDGRLFTFMCRLIHALSHIGGSFSREETYSRQFLMTSTSPSHQVVSGIDGQHVVAAFAP